MEWNKTIKTGEGIKAMIDILGLSGALVLLLDTSFDLKNLETRSRLTTRSLLYCIWSTMSKETKDFIQHIDSRLQNVMMFDKSGELDGHLLIQVAQGLEDLDEGVSILESA